jgi:MFS family permease
MLWFVCFLNYADRQAIFSVFTLLKEQFRLSDVQLGVVASCFMWLYAVCGPLAGWIADRFSVKWIIVVALTFWSVVTAGTALAHGYASLLLLRSLGGLGEALYYPAAMSLVGMYHGPATRSRAMALHQSSVYAGTIAGGALSAILAQAWGWQASFIVLGLSGIIFAAFLSYFLQEPRGPTEDRIEKQSPTEFHPVDDVRDVLRGRATSRLIAIFIGANFVAVIFLTWMPTFLLRKFHMSLANAGFSGTAYLQVASVLGVMLGGFLADSLARTRRGGRQIVQAIGLLVGCPFIFLIGTDRSVKIVLLAMVGFGLGKGLYDSNIWASLYDTVPPRLRGIATGLMNSLGWLGGGLAPLAVAAAALRIGFSASISASAAIYLILSLFMFQTSRKVERYSS